MQEYEIKHRLIDAILAVQADKGWTQMELAEKLGTHQSRISIIVNRMEDVRLDTLVSYCARLGLTLNVEVS